MDSIREIFDALSQRIRSPVIGYVILMVLLFNWKVFFFLFFSGESAEAKFTNFDDHTDRWSLFVFPTIVGIAAAILTPWINVVGQWAVTKPMLIHKKRNAEAAHELALLKAGHKNAENKLIEGLIEAAKQDEQVMQIEDDETRNRLQQQINELREERSSNLALSGDASSDRMAGLRMEIELIGKLAENARQLGKHDESNSLLREAIELNRKLHGSRI